MRYTVYVIATASRYIGEVEASSEEEAKEKGFELENCYIESLCYHCAGQVEIGDVYDVQVEPAD